MSLKVKKVNGVPPDQYPSPVKRPLNSRLSLEKLNHILGLEPRSWESALKDCMEKL